LVTLHPLVAICDGGGRLGRARLDMDGVVAKADAGDQQPTTLDSLHGALNLGYSEFPGSLRHTNIPFGLSGRCTAF